MDLGLAAPIIVGGLLITPATSAANAHRKDWFTYWTTGEYNLDKKANTDDWAEMKSGQTGNWFLIKITRYDNPWTPNGGGVEFYTKDAHGHEHRNYWRLSKWAECKESRRSVSAEQKRAISCAGNNWPVPFPPEGQDKPTPLEDLLELVFLHEDGLITQFKNSATSCNSMATCVTKLRKLLEEGGSDLQINLLTESVAKNLEPMVTDLIHKQLCKKANQDS